MFKMKYLINRNVVYYHNKWGGFIVGVFVCILKINGSNLMNGVVCDQQW